MLREEAVDVGPRLHREERVEAVAAKLRTGPRRLRRNLFQEGACFQELRTRLRGELAVFRIRRG